MLTALGMIGKKLLVDLFADPEKGLKTFFVALVIPIILLILIFVLPIVTLTSIPTLLINPGGDDLDLSMQMDMIAIYQNVPSDIEKDNQNWIEDQKKEYSWCDDIKIENNFTLDWQQLMAIDAVRYNQDFSGVTKSSVLNLGYKFLLRNVKTEKYQEEVEYIENENYKVQEPYQVEEEYQELVTKDIKVEYEEWEPWVSWMPWLGGRYITKTKIIPKGEYVTKTREVTKYREVVKSKSVTKTKTVTKERAILSLSSKSFDNVLKDLKFNEFDSDVAFNIYLTTLNLGNEGVEGYEGEFAGGAILWPVPGQSHISSPYGWRTHPIFKTRKFHSGIDIPAPMGQPFIAPADGKVTYSGFMGGYGNTVIIDLGDGISILGAHNSQLLVRAGQEVTRGQVVAKIGSTGNSTGPHLHFEVRINDKHTNPIPFLK